MTLPFGKYKGMDIEAVPVGYLHWLVDNVADTWKQVAEKELFRRENPTAGVSTALPLAVWMEKLAEVLVKTPDQVMGKEYFIKTPMGEFVFTVSRKASQ